MIDDFSIFKKLLEIERNSVYINNYLNEGMTKDGQAYFVEYDDEDFRQKQRKAAKYVLSAIGYMAQGGVNWTRHEQLLPKFKEEVAKHFYKYRIIFDAPDVKTFATDGINLFVSTNFVLNPLGREKNLSPREIEFILCHEFMHIFLEHNFRESAVIKNIGDEITPEIYAKHFKWNKAGDYEGNLLIDSLNLVTRDVQESLSALINDDYYGKTAEQIYNLLPDEKFPENKNQKPKKVVIPLEKGMVVKIKDTGEYAVITDVFSDDSFTCEIISEEKARELLKKFIKIV